MRRFLRDVSMVTVVILSTGTAAWAQATAQLNGRVTGESGPRPPRGNLAPNQTGTTFSPAGVTHASGNYVMTNLPTGPYRLEIALQGFRTYVQTGIVLQV